MVMFSSEPPFAPLAPLQVRMLTANPQKGLQLNQRGRPLSPLRQRQRERDEASGGAGRGGGGRGREGAGGGVGMWGGGGAG